MGNNLKKMLPDAGPKPDPVRKDAFIRNYRQKTGVSGLNSFEMIKSQAAYIKLPVWIISFAALAVAVWGVNTDYEILFPVSAIMPFVSGIAVLDTLRSRVHGMTEMEAVTLYSMRGMLFARLICIGIVHIILLGTLTFLIGSSSGQGILMSGMVITLPYLISSIGCLELERTSLGRNNALTCLAVSATVMVTMIIIMNERTLFSAKYRWIWMIVFVAAVMAECYEIKKTYRWEEYAWN